MKSQEVGAEDSAAMPSPGVAAVPVGGSSHPRATEPGHLWHCWKVNQSLGSLLLCCLLPGAQLSLKPMPTPAACVIQAAAPTANSLGVQRDFQTANATCLYKQPLYPPLGSVFSVYRTPVSSPHALGLLLEKLSDVERPGRDSPGCFWG